MKFLVDECIGPSVARWLRSEGHEAYSITEESPGINDGTILSRAHREQLTLITTDKDFGELIFRQQLPHSGIILLRLDDETVEHKIAILKNFLKTTLVPTLTTQFVVITENGIRIRT